MEILEDLLELAFDYPVLSIALLAGIIVLFILGSSNGFSFKKIAVFFIVFALGVVVLQFLTNQFIDTVGIIFPLGGLLFSFFLAFFISHYVN